MTLFRARTTGDEIILGDRLEPVDRRIAVQHVGVILRPQAEAEAELWQAMTCSPGRNSRALLLHGQAAGRPSRVLFITVTIPTEIGRAACRERECQSESISVVGGT